MKKIIVFAMVLAICLCMAVPAFAAGTVEADYKGESKNQDVNVTINGDIVHVYLVDIEFTNPTFTYSSGSVWDPENYVYKPNTEAAWAGKGTVKIVNHSDLPVNYEVKSENVVTTFGPLSLDVTDGIGSIAKCEVGDERGSHNATATFKVSGEPTVSEITGQKLGEIVVKITK